MGKKETRAIEMYIGVGTDFGTWDTAYVDIPIDTPDEKISEVAIEVLKQIGCEFVFAGVYFIPELNDQPYCIDD